MSFGFVYCWINTSNNKWYIGSHCGETTDPYIGSGKAFLASYKKNPSNFIREIIYVGCNFRAVEELILTSFDAAKNRLSYNLKNHANGGDTSMCFTDESRRKMSEASKSMKGRKTIPIETRKKISQSLKGRKLSVEFKKQRAKQYTSSGNPFFGKKHSVESKKKMSEAMLGKCPPKEVMDALHNGNKKKIYCSKEGITFDSISECAAFFNKSACYISNMLSGRTPNKYGLQKVLSTNDYNERKNAN